MIAQRQAGNVRSLLRCHASLLMGSESQDDAVVCWLAEAHNVVTAARIASAQGDRPSSLFDFDFLALICVRGEVGGERVSKHSEERSRASRDLRFYSAPKLLTYHRN